jgi:hypothetical protein
LSFDLHLGEFGAAHEVDLFFGQVHPSDGYPFDGLSQRGCSYRLDLGATFLADEVSYRSRDPVRLRGCCDAK